MWLRAPPFRSRRLYCVLTAPTNHNPNKSTAGPLTAKSVVLDDAANLAGLRILEGAAVMNFDDIQP